MVRMLASLLLLCASANVTFGQEDTRPTAIAPGALEFREERRLPLQVCDAPQGCLLVTWVDRDNPASRMTKVGEPQLGGFLEPGDLIVQIEGKKTKTVADYFRALRSAGPKVTLTIRDVNSGAEEEWSIATTKVSVPIPPDAQHNVSNSKLHVVYAAQTDKGEKTQQQSIAQYMKENVLEFNSLVKSAIREGRLGSFTQLNEPNCNALDLLRAVDNLTIAPQDALLVMYQGHGGYDRALASGDPAGGHFLTLTKGGLPRKDLLQHMLAKQPRLALLMTDCCNAKSKIWLPNRPVYEMRTHEHTGWTGLEELVFCYRGVLDLNGCAHDSFSWYSPETGGPFAHTAFHKLLNLTREPTRNWESTWAAITKATDVLFLEQKTRTPGKKEAALETQKHQFPTAFVFDIFRDEPTDTPTELITTNILVSSVVEP